MYQEQIKVCPKITFKNTDLAHLRDVFSVVYNGKSFTFLKIKIILQIYAKRCKISSLYGRCTIIIST